jgi:hypothetical protein
VHIERHVFGSFRGYGTLARSPGLSSEDARFLEGSAYGFGQTDDRNYLKSLNSSPAFFTRPLRGGRRALTRVLEGERDDNGRPTLRMVTAVVAQAEWDDELRGDVGALLRQRKIWEWTPGTPLESVDLAIDSSKGQVARKSAERIVELISELERTLSDAAAAIVISENDFSSDEVCAVEMLMPKSVRPRFSSACRCLSTQIGVSLNCLATEASMQRLTYRHDPSAPSSPFGRFLWVNGLSTGMLPVSEAIGYRRFGTLDDRNAIGSAAPVLPPPLPPPSERKPMFWAALGIGLVGAILCGFALGVWYGRRSATPAKLVAVTQPATQPKPAIANQPPPPQHPAVPVTSPPALVYELGPAEGPPAPPIVISPPISPQPASPQRPPQAVFKESQTSERPEATSTPGSAKVTEGIAVQRSQTLPSTTQTTPQKSPEEVFADAKQQYHKMMISIKEQGHLDEDGNADRLKEISQFLARTHDVPENAEGWLNEVKDVIKHLNGVVELTVELHRMIDGYARAKPSDRPQLLTEIQAKQQALESAVEDAKRSLELKRFEYTPAAKAIKRAKALR